MFQNFQPLISINENLYIACLHINVLDDPYEDHSLYLQVWYLKSRRKTHIFSFMYFERMENDLSEYRIWSFVVNIVVEERIQSNPPNAHCEYRCSTHY